MSSSFCFQTSHNIIEEQIFATWISQQSDYADWTKYFTWLSTGWHIVQRELLVATWWMRSLCPKRAISLNLVCRTFFYFECPQSSSASQRSSHSIWTTEDTSVVMVWLTYYLLLLLWSWPVRGQMYCFLYVLLIFTKTQCSCVCGTQLHCVWHAAVTKEQNSLQLKSNHRDCCLITSLNL